LANVVFEHDIFISWGFPFVCNIVRNAIFNQANIMIFVYSIQTILGVIT